MEIINFVCNIISSPWLWLAAPLLLGWVWVAKTAADDVLCSHINDLQTKKVDTDWKDYKARAYLSANVNNLVDNVWVKVDLDAESYDPGGNFDHAVNYRFTAPIAGFYLVCYSLRFKDVVANKKYDSKIRKNDAVDLIISTNQSGETGNLGVSGSDIFELAIGDFIELWGRPIAGVGTVDFYGSETSTYMAVHILSI